MRAILIAALALTACSQSSTPPSNDAQAQVASPSFDPANAKLAVEATPLDAKRVRFVVTTNLPTPVEVMAGLALAGQKDDEVFIGDTKRVSLDGARTEFVLDTSDASKPLPSGEYDAEVNFYQRWGAEKGNPEAKSAPDISATDRITFGGSGEKRADAERRNELQRWVMGNIGMNVPWNRATFEAKLGRAQKGPSTLSRLHDAYYFPDADMTFIVNRLKGEVTIWRMGDVAE